MTLKNQLLIDFGKDLPISGGSGQSSLDPIKLTTPDNDMASVTVVEVMRCIYGMLGWHWQIVKWDLASEVGSHIEKVTALIKYAEEANVVTEYRSVYFDVSAVNGRTFGRQTIPVVRLPLRSQMNLPWQIGWFHFDELVDNSSVDPGLGVSVAFSAPRAKMMVYVYDKGLGDSIQSNPEGSVIAEYQQAVLEFESLKSDARIIHERNLQSVRIKLYETEGVMHAVAIAPFNGYFFKLRLTQQDSHEKFLVDCSWYTISTFAHLVG